MNQDIVIPISAEQCAVIRMTLGLSLRPITDPPPDETDVLLIGPDRRGNERSPLVAGFFRQGTDEPGWYTHDAPQEVVDMVPMHWLDLSALLAVLTAVGRAGRC